MTEPALLAQEIRNRYVALPPEQKRDPMAALVLIVVELTRELMQHSPASVAEFIAFERAYCGRSH